MHKNSASFNLINHSSINLLILISVFTSIYFEKSTEAVPFTLKSYSLAIFWVNQWSFSSIKFENILTNNLYNLYKNLIMSEIFWIRLTTQIYYLLTQKFSLVNKCSNCNRCKWSKIFDLGSEDFLTPWVLLIFLTRQIMVMEIISNMVKTSISPKKLW